MNMEHEYRGMVRGHRDGPGCGLKVGYEDRRGNSARAVH